MEQTFLLQIEVSEVEEVSYIVAFRSAKLTMCGKIIQASGPLRYQVVDGLDVLDGRIIKTHIP